MTTMYESAILNAGNTAAAPPTPGWKSQVPVGDPGTIMTALRAAGLPLASPQEVPDEPGAESESSTITCIAAMDGQKLSALVATPSGLVYRFEQEDPDPVFWSFALRNYYLVTGNMADRLCMANQVGVDLKAIKGRCLSRKKQDTVSGFTLDALLEQLGVGAPVTGALNFWGTV